MQSNASVFMNRLYSKLRIRHLQALVTLTELGHVSRSAQALGLTQPAVTLLLADLERLLEAPLFLRHAKGITPTALASELLPLARQVLACLENGAELVATRHIHDEGSIRAAATVAGVNGLLAGALPAFSLANPRIQIIVSDADRAELSVTLNREAIDVVFCRQPALIPVGWQFRLCRKDSFVVACGNQHALAKRKKLALQDLQQARWLSNTVTSAARERFEALCAAQGWQPDIHPIVSRIPALTWTLLDTHSLLTLVPQSVVQPWLERGLLHILPLDLDLSFDPLGMLVPENSIKPACERLIDFVMQTYAKP
jgi:DNA-binding transcriptional LysR family regulator